MQYIKYLLPGSALTYLYLNNIDVLLLQLLHEWLNYLEMTRISSSAGVWAVAPAVN